MPARSDEVTNASVWGYKDMDQLSRRVAEVPLRRHRTRSIRRERKDRQGGGFSKNQSAF